MKNYTFYFLIAFIVTALLSFTGLKYPGISVVTFLCLLSGIALILSCLDAVLVSTNMKKIRFKKMLKQNRKNK